jgi:Recombination endonuclease VII
MKECNRCEQTKPLNEFHKNSRSPDKLHSICRTCKNAQAKERYHSPVTEARPVGHDHRANHLRRTYGITLEQYNNLLEKQDYCCAVCGKHQNEEKKRLSVDHNHATGEIRGLLCTMCNYRHVGKHRDSSLLRRIADYLDQGTGWFVPKKDKIRKRKPSRKTLFKK